MLHPASGGRPWRMLPGRFALLVIIGLLACAHSPAQPVPGGASFWMPAGDSAFSRVYLGASLGYARNDQNATFKVYRPGPDTCNCGIFGPAVGYGIISELSLEAPLLPHPAVRLLARLGLHDLSVVLRSGDTTVESRGPDGAYVTTVMHHEFHGSLLGLKLSAGGAIDLIPGLSLAAAPGAMIFVDRSQRQLQRITSPSDNLFLETGESTRPVDGHDPVDFVSVMFGIDIGLQGRIPLGTRIELHPEIRSSLLFGSVARNVSWESRTLAGLLGISYDLSSPPEPPAGMPAIDTSTVAAATPVAPERPRPYLGASIVARGVDETGRLYEDPVIEIQQAPWTEGVPIVPYIFFDSLSADIPSRYSQLRSAESRDRYSVDSLATIDPLAIHWQLLNVVGKRMQGNPAVRLTVTGTTSGDEQDVATTLGMARAQSVTDYLIRIWGIDPSRITVVTSPRSTASSPEENMEGRQENRRAELHFSDEELLRPVVIHRMATVASPPAVRFVHEIIADTTVAEWYITVAQGEKELLRLDGRGGSGAMEQQKQWSLADMRVNHDMTPIRYRLYVRDVIGQEVASEGTFRVAERTTIRPKDTLGSDREILQYSIVGFPYNSADLLPMHLLQLGDLAREITEQSDVEITGYTDRVGDQERNKQLSLSRARAVQDALRISRQRLNLPPLAQTAVLGLGGAREVFNNALPEGRLLSRMVRITVIKHHKR